MFYSYYIVVQLSHLNKDYLLILTYLRIVLYCLLFVAGCCIAFCVCFYRVVNFCISFSVIFSFLATILINLNLNLKYGWCNQT